MEHTIEKLQEAIREIDKKAEGGLCAGTISGVRAFHCDIRLIAKELGLQGGLTSYQDYDGVWK